MTNSEDLIIPMAEAYKVGLSTGKKNHMRGINTNTIKIPLQYELKESFLQVYRHGVVQAIRQEHLAITNFNMHGKNASYHFASDYGNEQSQGREEQQKALALFDDNPRLQSAMRKDAKNFLWSLSVLRPPMAEAYDDLEDFI